MFCTKCGTQLEDNACFCYRCGSPVGNNTSNSGFGVQQSAPVYNFAPVTCRANVVYPDGHDEIGDITISPTEIIFARKSKAVMVAFGYVGNSLENGEIALRFRVSDVAWGTRTRIGLNVNVYQVTMKNGAIYKLCLNKPKYIAYLENMFGNR